MLCALVAFQLQLNSSDILPSISIIIHGIHYGIQQDVSFYLKPGKIDPTRDKITTDNRKKGKAYRYCFGEQKSTALLLNVKDIGIPKFFRNSYIRDVTANYFGENEVTVPIQKEERYIYLGVFRPNGWIPVDMAISNGDKVTFLTLKPNILSNAHFRW